jgi:hypothetical protein
MRFGYLLREKPKDDPERWALYAYTFGDDGHVLMAIYLDRQSDLKPQKRLGSALRTLPNEWALLLYLDTLSAVCGRRELGGREFKAE